MYTVHLQRKLLRSTPTQVNNTDLSCRRNICEWVLGSDRIIKVKLSLLLWGGRTKGILMRPCSAEQREHVLRVLTSGSAEPSEVGRS